MNVAGEQRDWRAETPVGQAAVTGSTVVLRGGGWGLILLAADETSASAAKKRPSRHREQDNGQRRGEHPHRRAGGTSRRYCVFSTSGGYATRASRSAFDSLVNGCMAGWRVFFFFPPSPWA